MKTFFTLQSKGGVGKSFFTELMYIIANNLNSDPNKTKERYLFLDCDNLNKSLTYYLENSKRNKYIDIEGFSLLKEGDSIIDKERFFKFVTHIDTTVKKKYDYLFIDFGAETSSFFNSFLNDIGEDSIQYILNANFIPVVLFASNFPSSPGRACNNYFNNLPKSIKEKSIRIYNPHFDKQGYDIKEQEKNNPGIYYSIPKFEGLIENYNEILAEFFKEPNFKELLNTINKDKGAVFELSKSHGGIYKKYMNDLQEFGLQILCNEKK